MSQVAEFEVDCDGIAGRERKRRGGLPKGQRITPFSPSRTSRAARSRPAVGCAP